MIIVETNPRELFELRNRGHVLPELDEYFPFVAPDGPEMPPPGPNFLRHAVMLGDPAPRKKEKPNWDNRPRLTALYRRALYSEEFSVPIDFRGQDHLPQFVPGHLWGDSPENFSGGPQLADVMLVGKQPGREEALARRNFAGPTYVPLYEALQDLDIPATAVDKWYITNVIKFSSGNLQVATLPKAWFADCLPLLHQELRLVQPKFILCMGSEAVKTLLGKDATVSGMVGRAVDYHIPVVGADGEVTTHVCKVMAALHPAGVYHDPARKADFQRQLQAFWELVQGADTQAETDLDYACIYTERDLAALVDQMLADARPDANVIAVDAEWHGDYPTEPGAYLRTIQISNREKWGRCIVLHNRGGEPAFLPSNDRAVYHLKRLLKSTPEREVRVGGHFFRADLPWLLSIGLDLRDEYAPCPDVNVRDQGGWDTSIAYHAYDETALYQLELAAVRFTTVGRYDVALRRWKKQYCADNKIKDEELEGYGDCPDAILHSYSIYDVDATWRLATRFLGSDGLVYRDSYGNDCWPAYHNNHRASLTVLEMERTGFCLDKDRADELCQLFLDAQQRLLSEIQTDLNWPAFNPKSQPQMRVAVFGEDYARQAKADAPKLLPPGARTLGLTPLKSTGKRGRPWQELVDRRRDHEHTPAADRETLGILGHTNETVRKLRDYKFISQVLQTTLRKPAQDDAGTLLRDEDDNYIYEKGLMAAVHVDGRLRTHISQVKETGRSSSYRPNLQSIAARRESDYRRIIGADRYQHPVRSILKVPDGFVGIEADIKGAELAALAWLSSDPIMTEHVRRNNLPEDHPEFYDMHSKRAVSAFQLNCPPTKQGLKDAGLESLRVAAKNVAFGIPYGRQAAAITRQCHEEGAYVTEQQTQGMIEAYFDEYRRVGPFLEECRRRSQAERWLMNPYGRCRRFARTDDWARIRDQEREAQNFLIQSSVADTVWAALYHLQQWRAETGVDFQFLLQVHDAIVLLVPAANAERVYNEALPECMTTRVPFWPTHHDGTRIRGVTEPFYFAIDRDVFINWGETITSDQCAELNLPAYFATA
jgi:uracil-DNA glycosylase family 4